MGQPAAKQGDQIVAVDTHIILIPAIVPIPTPIPHPFNGTISGNLSTNVTIMGRPAATLGSTADNIPPHIPQGGPFQRPPTNRGQIVSGSARVQINGKPAARNGDSALTCNDPVDLPVGTVMAIGTVLIG
ncbi:MAG TPA: PAAR domain-containing protein [Kouleothrix sp.]|nr:PAAR domain-containing protein [Kouleothrix sp.]